MKIKTKVVSETGDSYVVDLDPSFKFVEHFTVYEMANKLSKDSIKLVMDSKGKQFADMMEEFRVWYNLPMTVNSWFRTESYNRQCGGDKNSAHMHGCAMDWGKSGHTPLQRNNVINKWKELCTKHKVIGAINLYTGGYHFEIYSNLWYGAKNFQIRDYRGTKNDW